MSETIAPQPTLSRSATPEPEPSPAPLMQLATGFWAFKTLAVAEDLDLFSRLAGTPGIDVDGMVQAYAIHPRPAQMLLTGCASLGLLEKNGSKYRNSAMADAYLVRGRPHFFGGFVKMLDRRLYPGWDKLGEAIRTNRPTTWDPDRQDSLFDGEDPVMLTLFWEAMHSISTLTARALGGAVDLGEVRRLLDVGGGSGAYDIELCKHYPQLRCTVYDLPFVTAIAAGKIAEAGLGDRIDTEAGDFFADPAFPSGHDAILLSMILHDWGEERNRALLRKCHAALPASGLVIVSELLVNDERTGPAPAALMSLNMLIETEGANYTPAEYGAWLEEAGFVDIRTIWFEGVGANGVVLATRP